MQKTKFKDGAMNLLTSLAKLSGDDLIYSLALEKGNVFVCVAAHPSMTNKRFDTGNERLLFLIDEVEYDKNEDDVIKNVAEQINEHVVIEEATNETA